MADDGKAAVGGADDRPGAAQVHADVSLAIAIIVRGHRLPGRSAVAHHRRATVGAAQYGPRTDSIDRDIGLTVAIVVRRYWRPSWPAVT